MVEDSPIAGIEYVVVVVETDDADNSVAAHEKRNKRRMAGYQKYKRLNSQAVNMLPRTGIEATLICSAQPGETIMHSSSAKPMDISLDDMHSARGDSTSFLIRRNKDKKSRRKHR